MLRKQSVLYPSIDPGELRWSITIQAPNNSSPGPRGASVVPGSWTTVLTARAAIYTAGGQETDAAAQLVSEVSHVVKIWWNSAAIKAGYQVLFGSRVFTIKYVENVQENNTVLLLYCLEVDQGGGV